MANSDVGGTVEHACIRELVSDDSGHKRWRRCERQQWERAEQRRKDWRDECKRVDVGELHGIDSQDVASCISTEQGCCNDDDWELVSRGRRPGCGAYREWDIDEECVV